MKYLQKTVYLLGVFIILITCGFSNSFGQKHTFTNNKGILRYYESDKTVKSDDIDEITIENLGSGLYKFTDSKKSVNFKYRYVKKGLYVYKKTDGWSLLISDQKLSTFAKGKPGKLIIQIEGAPFEFRYILEN